MAVDTLGGVFWCGRRMMFLLILWLGVMEVAGDDVAVCLSDVWYGVSG